ncbi:MAG: 2-C-methyl-D-erythritol 4-phosphate cytidylyltransferase [Ruminococcus sp.]|nr:2-C-methyl-D-erythritol 4-phosphate cytidylyltransferase [Ruminococcus sp.]MBQ8905913.1 2-C-methyl-D-erythritol 4-phosphate cytidylyltransferase [Ruminococcus sp.]
MDTSVIIVCAGNSTRMQGINKILLPLGDSNVIGTAMQVFEQCESVGEIVIVTRKQDEAAIRETAAALGITKLTNITEGGDTRQQSVLNGVRALTLESEYIAIHDGARPLVRVKDAEHVIKDARVFGAATLGVPVKDTIKTVSDGLITDTPPRHTLYITQTPQVFRRRLYLEGVDFSLEHDLDFTDDCQLVEAIGGKVYMTVGDYTNIKLTTPEDAAIAAAILAQRQEETA